LIFVAGAFFGGFVAALVRRLAAAVGLRPVDRTLGAVFGVLRGTVLLLAVAVVVHMTTLHEGAWWQDSHGAGLSTQVLGMLKPVLPEEFRNYLP
jgi:membrane protein required for colicin V production